MSRIQGEVMWPRLVANKFLKKRLGSTHFVADFPTKSDSLKEDIPCLGQPSLSANSFFSQQTDTTSYKVFVSTWNVGGVAPREDLDMEDWLNTGSNMCDVYVFGFQEIVPLRASNVLGSENNKISMKWNSMIREALNKKIHRRPDLTKPENVSLTKDAKAKGISNNQEFRCIVSKQMVGILISVWIRSDLRPYIRHPSVSCVGCGIMGCLGNKGSVSVRFELHETGFCFVCSHLASGGREGDEKHRNSDVAEILSRTTFPRGLPRKILDHDRVVLLGDLNYRIALPEGITRSLVERKEFNALLENDQLRMELCDGQILEGWHEENIKFAPTYKYCPNSDVYFGCLERRKGEKWRAPAWCDRIIWHGEGLKQHLYARGESKISDHRPVRAIFTAQVEVLQSPKGLQKIFLSDRFDQIINANFDMSSPQTLPNEGRSSFKI